MSHVPNYIGTKPADLQLGVNASPANRGAYGETFVVVKVFRTDIEKGTIGAISMLHRKGDSESPREKNGKIARIRQPRHRLPLQAQAGRLRDDEAGAKPQNALSEKCRLVASLTVPNSAEQSAHNSESIPCTVTPDAKLGT